MVRLGVALGWSRGRFSFGSDLGIGFLRYQVRGQPNVSVLRAKLPKVLEDAGVAIEIREDTVDPAGPLMQPVGPVRLLVWDDHDTYDAVTEELPSVKAAKLRAEVIAVDLAARLERRLGQVGYR